MSRPRPWEIVLGQLGEEGWDEATELASMIADEHYPDILREDAIRSMAAGVVVSLLTDDDYRRCIRALLQIHECSRPVERPTLTEAAATGGHEHGTAGTIWGGKSQGPHV